MNYLVKFTLQLSGEKMSKLPEFVHLLTLLYSSQILDMMLSSGNGGVDLMLPLTAKSIQKKVPVEIKGSQQSNYTNFFAKVDIGQSPSFPV